MDLSPKTAHFCQQVPQWIRFEEQLSASTLLNQHTCESTTPYLLNINRRFREGASAPARAAFFGPTGAGKSKLLNSLAGRIVSRAGFHRPCSIESTYYLHENWQVLRPALPGRVVVHDDPRFVHWILIDTPDFDSVSQENHREADRIFHETDAFLFVTDALKYADASTWDYLNRVVASEKKFVILLNKVNSDELVEDFQSRFRKQYGEDTSLTALVVVPELAIDDDALVRRDQPAIGKLEDALAKLQGDTKERETHRQRLGNDLRRLFDSVRCRRSSSDDLVRAKNGLVHKLDERMADTKRQLGLRLSTDVDPTIKGEVARRVQERLEAIDLLRYPRRIMAMPIRGIRTMLSKYIPSASDVDDRESRGHVATASNQAFHLLETELLAFYQRVRVDIRDSPPFDSSMSRQRIRELSFSHDQLTAVYEREYSEFYEWAANEARSTAAELTGQNKVKFILSQVIFNTALIGIQVQTGGMFSVLELGFDGVVSPLVAKAIGIAISSEKVKEFEQHVHEKHQALLEGIIQQARNRFSNHLDELIAGVDDLQAYLDEVLSYEDSSQQIIKEMCFSRPDTESSDEPTQSMDRGD